MGGVWSFAKTIFSKCPDNAESGSPHRPFRDYGSSRPFSLSVLRLALAPADLPAASRLVNLATHTPISYIIVVLCGVGRAAGVFAKSAKSKSPVPRPEARYPRPRPIARRYISRNSYRPDLPGAIHGASLLLRCLWYVEISLRAQSLRNMLLYSQQLVPHLKYSPTIKGPPLATSLLFQFPHNFVFVLTVH